MKNFTIKLHLANNSIQDYDFENGIEAITKIFGDDTGAPPNVMTFEATMDDGRVIVITFANDKRDTVAVRIED